MPVPMLLPILLCHLHQAGLPCLSILSLLPSCALTLANVLARFPASTLPSLASLTWLFDAVPSSSSSTPSTTIALAASEIETLAKGPRPELKPH
mmetsp:Transcript_45419/g.96662  ORF Transcript_45419/g.96662 Transcript_45419/m.96662 type:complete len:94 (+) Transcript_45419:414-695(+)